MFGTCCRSSDRRLDALGEADYATPLHDDSSPVPPPALSKESTKDHTHGDSEPPVTLAPTDVEHEEGELVRIKSIGSRWEDSGAFGHIAYEPGAKARTTALGTLLGAASRILEDAIDTASELPDRLKALQSFLESTYNNSIDMLEEDIRTLRQMKGIAVQSEKEQHTGTQPAVVSEEKKVTILEEVENEKMNRQLSKDKKLSTLLEALKESAPSRSLQIDITNPGVMTEQYEIVKVLGRGAFGQVSQAHVKATGAMRAVKTISKSCTEGRCGATWKLLCKEIEVCKMVDHPNVIRLYEIFDDHDYLHLVMELCTGGSLTDYIRPAGVDEQQAALAMLQIFRGVLYLHENMICHRDLKPDNVLVSNKERLPDTKSFCFKHKLRITDFGISCVFKKNQVLKAACGTPGYMAPELSTGKYNYLCDVWSTGAIMWRLMGGQWPNTLSAKMLDLMPGPGWKAGRSKEGQQLTKSLLNPEPNHRILLRKAVNHNWIGKCTACQDFVPLDDTIVKSLRCFRGLNKFKKAALNIIASLMSEDQIKVARNAFLELDSDGDGSLSMTELRDTLFRWKKAGMQDNEIDAAVAAIFFQPGDAHRYNKQFKQEVQVLHKRASWKADKTMPNFTYTEFLAATLNPKHISEALCRVAFQCFDKDGDGTLSKEELVLGRLLGQLGPDERDQLVEDLDNNGDGEIDFNEFCEMMKENEGWHKCFQGFSRTSFILEDDALSKVLTNVKAEDT